MENAGLVVWCLVLILFQVFHIFEEIGGRAYELAGSLNRYLVVAAVLVTINALFVSLIVLGMPAGYYLGILGAVIAIGNGLIHSIGYIKTRTFQGGIGAGMFTGIPLAIVGALVLYKLVGALVAQ